jgi:hypothetical protein
LYDNTFDTGAGIPEDPAAILTSPRATYIAKSLDKGLPPVAGVITRPNRNGEVDFSHKVS